MKIVERPKAPKSKIHSKDQFELCYLRHQYIRRSQYNPSKEDMIPYNRVIEYVSKRTFYFYKYLFQTVGLDVDDILNISRMHFVSFIGLFEISLEKNAQKYQDFIIAYQRNAPGLLPTESEILDKNKANFTLFMKQRMDDLVRICKQKAKNIRGLKIDDYAAFCGPDEPPGDIYRLLEEHEELNFRPIDNVKFKAVKRRAKIKDIKDPFKYADLWYAAVFLEKRELTLIDLENAGLDPRDGLHYLNPEQMLIKQQDEKWLDKITKMFKNYSKEQKASVLFGFIERHEGNPKFKDEIVIAQKFLQDIGVGYVRKADGL